MNTLLKQLAAIATPRHPWSDARDLITNGHVERADARGFTVLTSTGSETVDVPGGMTVGAYDNLAPFCSDEEKGIMAKGVLENMLKADYQTWDRFQYFRNKKMNANLEEWLPRAVAESGFGAVTAALKEELADFRVNHPPTPSWNDDDLTLRFGCSQSWTFTTRARCQIAVLRALQGNDWKPVLRIPEWETPKEKLKRLSNRKIEPIKYLSNSNVKSALFELRDRTSGILSWHEYRLNGASWASLK